MRKKMTVNTLAFGNLKNHKKQYTVMVIGIVLAMVFSSSVIISLFSFHYSRLEMGRKAMGIQDEILINISEKAIKNADKEGYIDEYGFAHMVGFASTSAENEENGFYLAWLDDDAKALSYQSFIEGSYPTNENEIAIEQSVLSRLGIEAQIGDEITLDVFPQNGKSHISTSNTKSYKLVGIAEDKYSHLPVLSDSCVPSAFVCEGLQTDVGGKESLVCYFTYADFDFEPFITVDGQTIIQDRTSVLHDYLGQSDFVHLDNENSFENIYTNYRDYYGGFMEESNIIYISIIGIVLALTSCIAIVNSFNSNIKERKQQMGMLRAVGTTRKQIINILGREALIISFVSIPVSLMISYLLVLALLNVFSDDFVLTIDVLSVVLCGVVGLITVMLAALIPIIHATRITPMQAIRNIDVSRKMKTKKIRSQKDFSVPKLLAKRSMAFHKGNQIAVSVILISTILFSCFGFSFVSYEKKHPDQYGYDYTVRTEYHDGMAYTNSFDKSGGMSDADKNSIAAAPYISKAFGIKICNINVLIDEYTDYYKILAHDSVYENPGLDEYNGGNYADLVLSNFTEYYSNIKSQAGFRKDFLPATLYAVDDWKLEELEDNLISGKINLDKLASGEEIILIAPQKAAVCVIPYSDSSVFDVTLLDEKIDNKFDYAVYGECEYKAGDTIDLSMIIGDPDDTIYTETENIYNFEKADKKVKIGAVISPQYFSSSVTDEWIIHGAQFGILTSIAGMNRFSKNEKYQRVNLFVDGEINDEMNNAIISYAEPILYKYDTN
ncbi:MAG: ABC transporter permease, partial [Eubacterium sp.]|nr:ABC transporter permease [Eubacterium sp.]